MDDSFFRKLSPAEEQTFRAWARDQWQPDTAPNPLWHPVVRAEWKALDDQRTRQLGG